MFRIVTPREMNIFIFEFHAKMNETAWKFTHLLKKKDPTKHFGSIWNCWYFEGARNVWEELKNESFIRIDFKAIELLDSNHAGLSIGF